MSAEPPQAVTPPEPAVSHEAEVPLLVPAGGVFSGLICFRGAGRIDGELTGSVVAEGLLVLGPASRVQARVEVDALVVGGLLEGDVDARDRVELQASGRVVGNVRSPRLRISEGGVLEGRCETPRQEPAGPPEAAHSAPESA